ncbi:DUF883 family protein [Roseospira marina]|uniref:DUF883 family protein n=2 Tax=Roseospira marina TaxID=140057 RepID=A0A5M6IDZ9_9PROT|nr:DUF883 family protein [Roseospira marina]
MRWKDRGTALDRPHVGPDPARPASPLVTHRQENTTMAETDAQLRKDLDQLRNDMTQIMSDVRTLAQERREQATSSARAYKDRVNDTVRDYSEKAGDTVRHYGEQASAQGARAADYASRQIESQPFTSVIAAFGIGVLAGRLLDGRR